MEFWIGLLSGTSADGVDAALVRIGSEPRDLELVAYRSEPMPPELQERIRGAGREACARKRVRLGPGVLRRQQGWYSVRERGGGLASGVGAGREEGLGRVAPPVAPAWWP